MFQNAFAYISLTYGKSKEELNTKYNGSYYNWIKRTTKYKKDWDFFRSIFMISDADDISVDYHPQNPIINPDNSLIVEVLTGRSTSRVKLESLINLAETNINYRNNTMICIRSLSELGKTPAQIQKTYSDLLNANVGILIPDYTNEKTGISSFSTCDYSFDFISDYNKNEFIRRSRLIGSDFVKKRTGENSSKGFSPAFIDAYYLHQNFLIGDREALFLSDLSINVFANKWKAMENNPFEKNYCYDNEWYNLEDLDKYWFAKYQKILSDCFLHDYYNLARRCIRIPTYIRIYQNFIFDSAYNIDIFHKKELGKMPPLSPMEIEAIVRSDISDDKMFLIRNHFDIPLINITTFKKYCIRELDAIYKQYKQNYLRKNDILCESIQEFFLSSKSQEEHDTFLSSHIMHS